MTPESIVGQARRVPPAVWVGVAALGLVWATRRRPSSAIDGGVVMGSEDIQPLSLGGVYNPIGAHAVGLPYDFHHLCPVTWEGGRTKGYPSSSAGVLGMLAAPDPSDDDGYAWLSYGPQRGA